MPNSQQIKRSLSQLSEESRRSTDPSSNNFATNLDVVNRSVDRIFKIPANARTPGQRAALKALEIWTGTPTDYASTADIPARYGMGRLDPNDNSKNDLKCNRFVAEVAATSGSPFPLSGYNPFNRTPVSAENLYQQESIPYMSNVNPKEAKIGDMISFPGHVGIYLGNSVYISARHSTDFPGNQVEDGVQITKVKWEQQPKFRRLDGRQASIDEHNNSETQSQFAVADQASPKRSIAVQRYEAIAEMLEQAGIQRGGSDWNQAVVRTAIGTDLDIKEVKDIAQQIPGISPSAADQLVDSNAKNVQAQLA